MMTRNVPSRIRDLLTTSLVLICLTIGAAETASAVSEKRMKPLSKEEVAQVWIGLSEDELYILRLSLDESGRGEAAYVFVDQPPRLFSIQSWTYRGGHIEMVLEAADDSKLEVPTLKGAVIGSSMKLTMSGQGWNRRVELRLEAALEGRWRSLKKAMETEKQ